MAKYSGDFDDFFESLFENPTERRINEYIIREIDNGRSMFEILDDPYIKNRVPEERRRQLLENPEVIEAFMNELNELRNADEE